MLSASFGIVRATRIPLNREAGAKLRSTGDSAMRDEWTKMQPDGSTVFYTSDVRPKAGGVIMVRMRDIAQIDPV